MLTISTVIEEVGATPNIAKKHLRSIIKDSLQDVLIRHHRKNIPKHFQPGAAQRYGYSARTRGYKRKKLRKMGHSRPLVWSGATERASRQANVSGSSSKARLSLKLPEFPYGRRATKAEILRVLKSEEEKSARLLLKLILRRLNAIRETVTTVVK